MITGRSAFLGALLRLFDLFGPPPANLASLIPSCRQLLNLAKVAAAALAVNLYQNLAGCRAETSRRSLPVILLTQEEKQ